CGFALAAKRPDDRSIDASAKPQAAERLLMSDIRFITLNPGHFHAALVQKEMYEQVDPRVHVYAPLGPDLVAHLGRIASFNGRSRQPTQWQLEVHAGADFLARFAKEKPGNAVVLAGCNAP